MAITVSGTSITFNDATVQTTAFTGSSGVTGASGQVFTSSGTFTIPSGITKVKVTVTGGGAGGNGNASFGGSGGNSTISSGTQTITTVTGGGGIAFASGGAGGTATNGDINYTGEQNYTQYGSYTCFVLGVQSPAGSAAGSTSNSYGGGGIGGYTASGGYPSGAGAGTAIKFLTSLTPGNTISVTIGAAGTAGAGSPAPTAGNAGIVIFEW